jgi:hypothetical protein
MELVRRYTRTLREKQAEYRGPRIGARERRAARAAAAREAAEDAAQAALAAVKPPERPAV